MVHPYHGKLLVITRLGNKSSNIWFFFFRGNLDDGIGIDHMGQLQVIYLR